MVGGGGAAHRRLARLPSCSLQSRHAMLMRKACALYPILFLFPLFPSKFSLQESAEAAQRADMQGGEKLAAAGHTDTGQTLREQVEGLKTTADPQASSWSAGGMSAC